MIDIKKYRFDYFTPPGYDLVDSSLINPLDDEHKWYIIK